MDFDAYARTAVDLVNSPLADLDDLRALFHGDHVWMCDEVCDRDLTVFRRAGRRLRDVFEYGTTGRDADAVAELNSLLAAFPVQPRISGHDSNDWHMHVTGRGASVSAEYLAGAVWGLSVWLCEYGSARFGVCADARCGNVYLDTSSNCCRRFCSERCATRSHVAAHRARKRAAVEDQPLLPVS
ncbi:CGNR zinc finger domain-containing protein [Solwaraspora sp. WMMB762]|uniref:CGNR zinc finger domain-containing protein n=1 Tax=Solwaraspora sp. WMMB762 TaxID=3404120 RepID=UPI003B9553AB